MEDRRLGLRVVGPGLAVVAAGLVTMAWSSGAGLDILAVGMVVYLTGAVVCTIGILLVYRAAPTPKPNFIQLRWSLIHDAVHTRASVAGRTAAPIVGGPARPVDVDAVRRSPHWSAAVWGVRLIVPGMLVIVAGLVTLVWSPPAGRVAIAVGAGLYLVGLTLSLVGGARAYGDVDHTRIDHALVRRILVHDAFHHRT